MSEIPKISELFIFLYIFTPFFLICLILVCRYIQMIIENNAISIYERERNEHERNGVEMQELEDIERNDSVQKIIIIFNKNKKSNTECSICQELNDETGIECECKNVYHEKCMIKWLENKKNCPMCRKEYEIINII